MIMFWISSSQNVKTKIHTKDFCSAYREDALCIRANISRENVGGLQLCSLHLIMIRCTSAAAFYPRTTECSITRDQ